MLFHENFLQASRADERYLTTLGYKLALVVHIPILKSYVKEKDVIDEVAVNTQQIFNKYSELFNESIALEISARFILVTTYTEDFGYLALPQFQFIKEQINLLVNYLSIPDINKGVLIKQLEVEGFGEDRYYSTLSKNTNICIESREPINEALRELIVADNISGLMIPALELDRKKCIKV